MYVLILDKPAHDFISDIIPDPVEVPWPGDEPIITVLGSDDVSQQYRKCFAVAHAYAIMTFYSDLDLLVVCQLLTEAHHNYLEWFPIQDDLWDQDDVYL